MPDFYTWAILLINQSDEIGVKPLSVFGSIGGQNSLLMHVPFLKVLFADFPNTKFCFPEFFSSNAWHVTIYITPLYHKHRGAHVNCNIDLRTKYDYQFRTETWSLL